MPNANIHAQGAGRVCQGGHEYSVTPTMTRIRARNRGLSVPVGLGGATHSLGVGTNC